MLRRHLRDTQATYHCLLLLEGARAAAAAAAAPSARPPRSPLRHQVIRRPFNTTTDAQIDAAARGSEEEARVVSALDVQDAHSSPDVSMSSTTTVDDIDHRRKQIYFYVDTVFPIRLGKWDPRYLLATVEKESLLDHIKGQLPKDTGHGFKVEAVEAREKDGGAFVRCSYIPDSAAPGQTDSSLSDIVGKVTNDFNAKALRPWYTWRTSRAHLVQGKPWREDLLRRFPSSQLKIEFVEAGQELSQEEIYNLFRPFGRIKDIEPQPASNKDVPKWANVNYTSIRSAAAARNSLYGMKYQTTGSSTPTVLRINYRDRHKENAFTDWLASHPRIVIPILAVLAGTLSYAIFDPIRSFFVKSKVSHLFDLDQYRAFRWLKKETVGRLGITSDLSFGFGLLNSKGSKQDGSEGPSGTGIEQERREAADKLSLWLKDLPDTFITVNGPPGSGKTQLVQSVTSSAKNILIIDCSEITKQSRGSSGSAANSAGDSKLVSALASQVGYFPQFQWAQSFNNLIDIASVGLIGTKAGFSTNLDVQIKQVLDVTSSALKDLADEAKVSRERALNLEKQRIEMINTNPTFIQNVKENNLHDGRLDCVAANGIMGELGMGIEREGDNDAYSQIYGPASVARAIQATIINATYYDTEKQPNFGNLPQQAQLDLVAEAQKGRSSTSDIDQIPIVIIKGFDCKDGGKHEVLWTCMADWAAALVENRIAHCIFVNDSVTTSRLLTRALPSKPFSSITLTDATSENALQYVRNKLSEYGREELVANTSQDAISRLGGRLTDLETLIQKMRGGANIEEAIDDIIARSATEIVKNCFGDDPDEAKSLPWSREQAWYLVKTLSKDKELSYADLLANGPFKGQEKALRALEQAEVIMVIHKEGRAATVRPGKPSYRTAFQALSGDKIFAAQNELAINSQAIAGAQATIKSSQEELIQLSHLFTSGGRWAFGATPTIPIEIAARVEQCLQNMRDAQESLAKLGEEAKTLRAALKTVQ